MSQQKQKQKNKIAAREKVTVAFVPDGWEDYQHWLQHDPRLHQQINLLIKEIVRTPFTGTGRPEALKGDLTGYWSRRIDREHRSIYFYEDGVLTVISCRYHYD